MTTDDKNLTLIKYRMTQAKESLILDYARTSPWPIMECEPDCKEPWSVSANG
jgi:hypothetical protein